ncbi:hypothetical protein LMH73_018820 [Vibrio splendidus]|nr:hypothetical protein [Vibrio splendidus]MCC4880755.1 hypothetical protein [Vibrio splendidus]
MTKILENCLKIMVYVVFAVTVALILTTQLIGISVKYCCGHKHNQPT